MSTLYRHGNRKTGVFYLSWYCAPGCPQHPKGSQQHCRSLRTRDKKAAEALQDAKDREIEQAKARVSLGLSVDRPAASTMTLEAFRDWYLEKAERERIVSPNTLKNAEGPYLNMLLAFDPKATLADLTEEWVQRYQATVRHRYSDHGWNSRRATLRSIFNRAVEWKLLPSNPFLALARAKPKKKRPKRLYQEQMPIILRETTSRFWKLVTLFLYATGCRLNELCNLKREDVRWKQGYLAFTNPKEGKERLLDLAPEIQAIIGLAESMNTSPYVFSLGAEKLNRETVKSHFDRITKRCGFPVSPHRFRHAHGTHTLEAGGNLKTIQATLGHADIRTTADFYLDVDFAAQRRSIGLLGVDKLLSESGLQ